MMRRTAFVSILAALFASGPLIAQTGQIAGTVISSDGARPLSGATVSVAGASQRAVTGPDGRYSLDRVGAGTYQVTASVLGHAPATRSVTVTAGQTATANFTLQATAVALQSVVAIGYGERRIRDVTGSVQAVTPEQFNGGRIVSPEQLIQGKVAGVQVVTSGEPGGGSSIRIRGGTSIAASNEPLFVVDGVPLENGGGLSAGRNPLNFINPNDIARVTVLKDASSTAIYGARAANGVIMIETKTGSSGGPAFSYSSSVSTSHTLREPQMLTADQFRSVVSQNFPSLLPILGTARTDWRNAVERNGFGQEHSLAMAGAATNLNYRVSLNYLDQKGVLDGSETKRTSLAMNYNHRLFDNALNVRASVRGSRSDDDFTPGSVLGSATNFDPTQPIQTEAGFYQSTFILGPSNPLAELAQLQDRGTTYRSLGNIEARYQMPFLEGLSGTLRLGYDVARSERDNFAPAVAQSERREANKGMVSQSNPTETSGLLDGFFTYQTTRGRSDVDATAGYSYQSTSGRYPYFQARGLAIDLLGPNGVPSATQNTSTIYVRDTKLASFFGRVNYTLNDRYLLTLSVRRDGSSRFGPTNQWGTFPAAALAWRVSEEPWFGGLGFLSDLKVRGSWGVNGNQAIGDYRWVRSYTPSNSQAEVQFGDQFVPTIRPSAVDPAIKWEETTSYDAGIDYGLFGDRVTGSLDFYTKRTKDLLFDIPVPAGWNVSNVVTTNIGSMRNTGVELGLSAQLLRGTNRGLSWNASFNASTNRNRLLTINPAAAAGERILVGDIAGGVGSRIQVLQPGVPVYSFYVYHHNLDANGKPVYADVNGDHVINEQDLYADRNGDGTITQDDRAAFHSPFPRWILSHTSNLGYRSFDAGFTLRANLGNYAYNNLASSQGWYNLLNAAGGPVNLHSSVLTTGFKDPQFFSDYYVEDASFLRMDNVTVGYTLPHLRQVQAARIYGTVQNVFTLTGYSGLDPEAGLNGIDNNIYPRSRTFTLGVSLGF
jgi:TonB-linked SusC/RagA family outer membrane protein